MKRNDEKDVPVFFFNSGDEDREALRFLLDSGMTCEFRAAAEAPTPLLLVGYRHLVGLKEIQTFVSEALRKNSAAQP